MLQNFFSFNLQKRHPVVNVWATRLISQRTGFRECICFKKSGNSAVKWKRLTVIFTFTKQSVMDIDIYAHFDQNNTSKICKQSLGLSAFLFFLLTARNKCISGKQGKDKYSFLEKISFNLPLYLLKNNRTMHAFCGWRIIVSMPTN